VSLDDAILLTELIVAVMDAHPDEVTAYRNVRDVIWHIFACSPKVMGVFGFAPLT
jgi:hypothetical protein